MAQGRWDVKKVGAKQQYDERMSGLVERDLSADEFALAEWVLSNMPNAAARNYLPQLAAARVTGKCDCGCPTIYMRVDERVTANEPIVNPIGDAFGLVGDKKVGVLLFQRKGKLDSLEVYDLSDIKRPYGLPGLDSVAIAQWEDVRSKLLKRSDSGIWSRRLAQSCHCSF